MHPLYQSSVYLSPQPSTLAQMLKLQAYFFINKRGGKVVRDDAFETIYIFEKNRIDGQMFKMFMKINFNGNSSPLVLLSADLGKCHLEDTLIIEKINLFNTEKQPLNSCLYLQKSTKELVLRWAVHDQKGQAFQAKFFTPLLIQQCLNKAETSLTEFLQKIRPQPETNTSKNIFVKLKKRLAQYKEMLQKEIRSRQKSSLPPSSDHSIQSTSINPSLHQIDLPENKYTMTDIQLLLSSKKEKKDKEEKILRKIGILNKKQMKSWRAPETSFGFVTKWDMEYSLDFESIHDSTNLLVEFQKEQDERHKTKVRSKLIKKVQKDGKNAEESFNNEICILKYLRNCTEPTIATYFIDKNEETIKSLYISFYPQGLWERKLREREALNFCIQLAQGINFLQNNFVSHRDLKPHNIMLNFRGYPKIIDFGSAFLRDSKSEFHNSISPILRTTCYYNKTAKERNYVTINSIEFEQHENFDMYSYGVIARDILFETQTLKTKKCGIFSEIDWLFYRCTDENPANRLNGHAAALYGVLLLKIWESRLIR